MKRNTNIFATTIDLDNLKGVTGKDRIRNMVHEMALAKGLPPIAGIYSINKFGEFLRPEEDQAPAYSPKPISDVPDTDYQPGGDDYPD